MGREIASAVLALLLTVACDEPEAASEPRGGATERAAEPAEEAPAEAEPPPVLPEPTPAQRLMRGHFRRASEARDALIRGDIERARADMRWLAAPHEGAELAADLQPRLEAMRDEAASFAEASTLTEAGRALARTLLRCGECHRESGGGFEPEAPPLPGGDDRRAHMRRHLWAAARMWEGLVTANPERFDEGAGALEEVALHAGDLPPAEDQPPERVAALAQHVHDLGREARSATSAEARAQIYGSYLATCAACHRLLGRGPAAPPEPTTEE